MSKKIISFSLWGEDPKYTMGAVENVELAKVLFHDWVCRFHVGSSVPDDIITLLGKYNNVELVLKEEPGDWSGMFWRFLDAADEDVDVMISRDTDSRLSARERWAIDEWLKSDKCFHSIRDYQLHSARIMGGMWGAKKGCIPEIKELLEKEEKGDFWQVDQNFLKDKIYPLILDKMMLHAGHGGALDSTGWHWAEEKQALANGDGLIPIRLGDEIGPAGFHIGQAFDYVKEGVAKDCGFHREVGRDFFLKPGKNSLINGCRGIEGNPNPDGTPRYQ
jgi:hypothetical protein